LEIVNIVAIALMNEPFDLELLASKLDNTEFTPSKVWLKMRLKPNNEYIAFYASGKFLITGLKTFNDVEDVVKRVVKKLKESNIKVELEEIKITNIVITDEIELKTPLDTVINSLDTKYSSYEPEQFPGLFYKDSDGISYTLFSSGKIIMTGVKNLEIAKNNLKNFKDLINSIGYDK